MQIIIVLQIKNKAVKKKSNAISYLFVAASKSMIWWMNYFLSTSFEAHEVWDNRLDCCGIAY